MHSRLNISEQLQGQADHILLPLTKLLQERRVPQNGPTNIHTIAEAKRILRERGLLKDKNGLTLSLQHDDVGNNSGNEDK